MLIPKEKTDGCHGCRKRTRKCLRRLKNTNGNLSNRPSITLIQIMMSDLKLRNDDFTLNVYPLSHCKLAFLQTITLKIEIQHICIDYFIINYFRWPIVVYFYASWSLIKCRILILKLALGFSDWKSYSEYLFTVMVNHNKIMILSKYFCNWLAMSTYYFYRNKKLWYDCQ